MSYSVTIPFGRGTGTKYNHHSGDQGQAKHKFFHVFFFKLGTAFILQSEEDAVAYSEQLIKEIPEDIWLGRVYAIVVENENNTRLLHLIVFPGIFLFAYGKTTRNRLFIVKTRLSLQVEQPGSENY